MTSLGLIAGNGPLPVAFAKEAKLNGITIVAVGHTGETREELRNHVAQMTWISVGELGEMIRALHQGGVTQAIMLGGIDKKRALNDLRIDERGWRVLRTLSARGDDALLVALAKELEGEGIKIVSSKEWLSPWLAPAGTLSSIHPNEQQQKDIRLGIRTLASIGSLDIGQTVVIKEGVILAVEAIEGTDEAIRRGGELGGSGCVVVKGSKPKQDMRFDVPVAGPETIKCMIEIGASLLALEAGQTFMIEREKMLRAADIGGICILGWTRESGDA
jgi:DUF1009 family protein